MRSKAADAAKALEGDPPEDEGSISSSVPSGGISRWEPNNNTNHASTDLLYVNLEETYPPSPPFLERDPNMSSTARYSPIHGTPATLPSLPPLQHAPLLQTYRENSTHHSKSMNTNMLCDDSRNILNVGTYALSPNNNPNDPHIDDIHPPDITQYISSYSGHVDVNTVNNSLQNERLAPLLNAIDDVTCSDDVASEHDTNVNFYPQQVFTSGDGFGVSNSNEAVYLPSTGAISTVSSTTTQMLDGNNDMHLVFSSNGDFHMIGGNTIKQDQVELLITNNQAGISYSLSKENGFIIARPTENSCNTLKNQEIKYDSQNIPDLSTLSNSNFNNNRNVINSNNVNLELGIVSTNDMHNSNPEINVTNIGQQESSALNNFDISNYLNDDSIIIETNIRRDRKQPMDTDTSITCIPDKSVPCRAKASLPVSHLLLYYGDDKSSVLGVFAKRRIPIQARFGPLEGVRQHLLQNMTIDSGDSNPQFFIHNDTGDFTIDVSDERMSNWMRYVRFSPGPNQNVCLQQLGDELFFTTSKPISPHAELILGYSVTYARRWGLPLPNEDEGEVVEWPCFECPMQFTSSVELQDHLNTHDDMEKSSLRKVKKKIIKKDAVEHRCEVCNRNFPSFYRVKQHMKTHITNFATSANANVEIKLQQRSPTVTKPSKESKIVNLINKEVDQSPKDLHLKKDWTSDESNSDEFVDSNNLDVQKKINAISECEEINENALIDNKCQCKINEAQKCQRCNHNNNEEMQINCFMCTDIFQQFPLFIEHLQNEHQFNLQMFVDNPLFDKYIQELQCDTWNCPICKENFMDCSELKEHILKYHDVKKYFCAECKCDFETEDKLELHNSKMHKKQKEFICPNCNKQFKRKDKLKDHIARQQKMCNNKEVVYTCSERANNMNANNQDEFSSYLLYTFKCHPCRLGFKRRGMLVNHLARRHPEISRASVPELQLPIIRLARDYFCQHCDKVYQSSSKRKAHILKNHPGESLPPSSRNVTTSGEKTELETFSGFSTCVGAVSSIPHHCPYAPCHKQYASKAKLSQHIRHKHMPAESKENSHVDKLSSTSDMDFIKMEDNSSNDIKMHVDSELMSIVPNSMMEQQIEDNYILNQDINIVSSSTSRVLLKKPLPPLQHATLQNKCVNAPPVIFNISSNGDIVKHKIDENVFFKHDKLSNQPTQIIRIPKNDESDSAMILESLRTGSNIVHVIHIPEVVDISEKTEHRDTQMTRNEMPKLHISGHILSMDASNKLPPMSILSKNAVIGNVLTNQYTDR